MGNAPVTLNRIHGLPFFGLGGHYTTGNTLFVDSGHPEANDNPGNGSPDAPLATIDYAVGQCTASNGDTIYAMPGHTETISAAGGITLDVAGVSIVGLGNGTNRPLITVGTDTAAEVSVTANNCKIANIQFTSAINDLENFINVAAHNFTLEGCYFYTASALEAICFVNLNTTYDWLKVRSCEFYQPTDPAGTDAAAGTGCFYFVDSENLFFDDCFFYGNFETAIWHNKTTAAKNVWCRRCYGTQLLSGAELFVQVAAMIGGIDNGLMVVTGAADMAEAATTGTMSDAFFAGLTFSMGNDGGGGQKAIQPGAAVAS